MKLTIGHIILGALVIVAIAGGILLALRQPPSANIEVVSLTPTLAPADAVPTPLPLVGVYISGAVVNPGVYIVNEGSRLADIILIAGGAAADADLTAVNLAAVLQDEQHWHIPKRIPNATPLAGGLAASGGDPAAADGAQPNRAPNGKVDLNAADVDLLKTLPGIGDTRARAIVSHRELNGAFPSVDALLDVNGIGIGTLEALRNLVEVR